MLTIILFLERSQCSQIQWSRLPRRRKQGVRREKPLPGGPGKLIQLSSHSSACCALCCPLLMSSKSPFCILAKLFSFFPHSRTFELRWPSSPLSFFISAANLSTSGPIGSPAHSGGVPQHAGKTGTQGLWPHPSRVVGASSRELQDMAVKQTTAAAAAAIATSSRRTPLPYRRCCDERSSGSGIAKSHDSEQAFGDGPH